jgi:hypothetical protein
MTEETYVDAKGNEIVQGDRVRIAGLDDYSGDPSPFGEIVELLPADGDVDDYGRSVLVPPTITVKFDDGDEDRFSGDANGVPIGPPDEDGYPTGWDVTYTFEDVEKEIVREDLTQPS